MAVRVAPSKYLIAPVGSLFGKWEVLGYSHYAKEHYWHVKCTGCGKVRTRRATQLVLKRTSSCRSCLSKTREAEKSPSWRGCRGISAQYLNRLKHRPKEVTITLDDLADKWEEQLGICVFTGEKLFLETLDNKIPATASIDRIDSNKGYIPGNVQWVSKRINLMKSNLTDEEFISICSSVTKYRGGSCGS